MPKDTLTAQDLRNLPDDQLKQALSQLTPKQLEELKYNWQFWARPEQIPPPGNWNTFLALAGRGWGKTKASVEWVREQVKQGKKRIAYVCATNSDIERTFVKGESGILNACWDKDKTYRGAHLGRPEWSPTKRTLFWANGAKVEAFSAEEPERLRGPQFHAAACDELCAWNKDEDTWSMLQFCLRLGKHPKVFIATTPKPTKLIRKIMQDPKTLIVRGSTFENSDNLAPTYLEAIKRQYEGTRLGKQELYAEVLEEAEGALWTTEMIDGCQIDRKDVPELSRIVVSIDPATTANKESDMTGIVVAGIDVNGIVYILGDYTEKLTPQGWANRAISLYHRYQADRIVAEKNQGGDMVKNTLQVEDETVPIKLVHASRGKFARAEPVSALYERGMVKHVRNPEDGANLEALETQMRTWEPLGSIGSPDRLDACFIVGTPVLTEYGYKPIESVKVGERVLTREGYKEIEWSGKTFSGAPTLEIGLSSGYIVGCTPEHPFYVQGKGWVRADELTEGDSLVTEQEVKSCANTLQKLRSTEIPTADTQTTLTSQNSGITHSQVGVVSGHSTETFGNTTTDLSQKGTTSTTKTGTTSITNFLTSNACHQNNTQRNMQKSFTSNVSSKWTMHVNSLLSGTALRKVWSSIVGWVKCLGKDGNLKQSAVVKSADQGLSLTSKQSIVQNSAITKSTKLDTKLKPNALCADQHSNKTSINSCQEPAPVSVVQVSEGKKADVYNLHVKDCHEFLVSGVLVHNCTWAVTELALKSVQMPPMQLVYTSAKGLR